MASRSRRERTELNENDGADRVLLVAMPRRHLESAREIADEAGSVVLPAGGPGELDVTARGTHVLVIEMESDGSGVPAASWAATFVGRIDHDPGDPWPEGLPATWIQEHGVARGIVRASLTSEEATDREIDDDEDEEEDVGPQSFFRVRGLRPVPRSEWVFANELVPKQRRGGRTFVPRTPMLVTRPE